MRLIYGPVPSWRLGRSLGVDLVASKGKTCTVDCVYCQLGRTIRFTDRRQVFVDTERLEAELAALSPLEVDYVTFSGTGEPTLAANLDEALELVKAWPLLRGVPTAVLTNSTLMSRPDVRRDLARADFVVAKLDAPGEHLFQAINRPGRGCAWAEVVGGIRSFRQEFKGKLALQMMFIAANQEQAAQMAALAWDLNADEVQLNTPLRPSPTPPLGKVEMAAIELAFAGLPVVNVYSAQPPEVRPLDSAEMRRRRPAEGHPRTVRKEVS
jgi:wyosine [tRNA(Phe)-imidazoG37] synthetase (radical SAM superfamily)